jgi:hypothetical protein
MSAPSDLPSRLKADSPALGYASEAEIEQRAAELARSDGRANATEADYTRAAGELAGGARPPAAPETSPALEQVTAWDDPVDQSGHRVERTSFDDEENIGAKLIQDGLEEADHGLRAAAEDDAELDQDA